MVDIYFKATTTQCSKKRGRGNEIQLSLALASYFEYSQKDEDNIMSCCVINSNKCKQFSQIVHFAHFRGVWQAAQRLATMFVLLKPTT